MNNPKVAELKQLDKLAKKIAKKKARLQAQLEAEKEVAKWYDEMLKESGYKRPRDLIKAIMVHFGIRSVSLVTGKRGPGRPKKSAPKATGKRKRTKVTPELRDEVRAAVKGGLSKNRAAKQFGISYVVIKKIVDGGYDKI